MEKQRLYHRFLHHLLLQVSQLASAVLLLSTLALADAPHPYDFEVNQSFLSNTQIGNQTDAQRNEEIQNKIYGTSLSRKLTQEYLDMNRDYDFRARYGLNSAFSEADRNSRNSGFGHYVMRNIFDYQVDESMKKAERVSEEGHQLKRTHDTIQTIVHASTKFDLSKDVKFGTKTDLPGQRGQVWMHSSVVNADLNATAGHSFSLTPTANTSNTAAVATDHLFLNMNRDLGFFGLKSTMSYGFESTKMNNSVTKLVLPNLSAEVATTRGLNPEKSGMSKSEESLRMTYGIRF